jgi:RNase P subunit RPR2
MRGKVYQCAKCEEFFWSNPQIKLPKGEKFFIVSYCKKCGNEMERQRKYPKLSEVDPKHIGIIRQED